ncbi:MAG TPA: hypothetical protein PLY04_17830 [bacterium]|nr:hypothetical protein [bacterium]
MAPTKTNIIVCGTSVQLKVGGTDVGYTAGGVELELADEHYDVIADQSLTPVLRKLTARTCKVRTTMLEATLENLRLAWNLADTALVSSSLTLNSSEKGEVAVVFVGKGPGTTVTRTATFFAAVAMATGPIPNFKDKESQIPVEFECLWSDTNSAFGTIVDASS